MHFRIDVFKNKVIIPIQAKTDAGYFLDIEPAEVINTDNPVGIEEAFKRLVQRGNPLVAAPKREAFPKPVVLSYSGSKSLHVYERSLRSWYVEVTETAYQITPLRHRSDRGFEEELENAQHFSVKIGIPGLAKLVAKTVTAS
jgi:hypothetical protein